MVYSCYPHALLDYHRVILSFLKHFKDTFELMFSCCCCIVWRFSGWVVSNFCGHNSNATIYQQVRWTSLVFLSLFWISGFNAFVLDLTFWSVCGHHSNATNKSGGHVPFWILKFLFSQKLYHHPSTNMSTGQFDQLCRNLWFLRHHFLSKERW